MLGSGSDLRPSISPCSQCWITDWDSTRNFIVGMVLILFHVLMHDPVYESPTFVSTCEEMKNVDTLKMKLNLTLCRNNPEVTVSHVRFYTVSIFIILQDEEQISDLVKWLAWAKTPNVVKKSWNKWWDVKATSHIGRGPHTDVPVP